MIKKKIITFIMFFFSTRLLSTTLECGLFEGKGIIKVDDYRAYLVINEKTQSEFHIYFNIPDQAKIIGFNKRDITAQFSTTKPFNGTVVNATELLKVSLRTPDPMNPSDTKLTLLKKQTCQ
ncbi:MAG: hypothetical protein HOP07_01470 [Bacteriovoracaceae bacterium]|nr:hypothetical protein [Bacteriovoracaceae bacterium]